MSLEMLHTLPNVSYLAKVRNTDEVVHLEKMKAGSGGMEEQGAGEEVDNEVKMKQYG